ncbi:MAG: hypothetical protein E7076_03625 [Bacteroidales bacterium]|nr:hypothetical protein [Bacteroidales bacterium]
MASGIVIKKNLRGVPTSVTINLKKYGNMLQDFFRTVGIEDKINYEVPNAKTRKAIRDASKGKTEGPYTLDEFKEILNGL